MLVTKLVSESAPGLYGAHVFDHAAYSTESGMNGRWMQRAVGKMCAAASRITSGPLGASADSSGGQVRRCSDVQVRAVVMMRGHTAPALAECGEGLNL